MEGSQVSPDLYHPRKHVLFFKGSQDVTNCPLRKPNMNYNEMFLFFLSKNNASGGFHPAENNIAQINLDYLAQ